MPLKSAINRYLDDGVRTYTLKDLGVFGNNDWPKIEKLIAEWELRGLLKVIKPIKSASANEVVIEMLNYIDADSPWPNWPMKK